MATGSVQPFKANATVYAAATNASQAVALPAGGSEVLIYNASAAVAFLAFGVGSGITVTPAGSGGAQLGIAVPPASRALVSVGPYVDHAAVVLGSDATGGNVWLSRGDGTTY